MRRGPVRKSRIEFREKTDVSRYETGFQADVDGVMFATGAALRVGRGVFGVFVEAGWASSDAGLAYEYGFGGGASGTGKGSHSTNRVPRAILIGELGLEPRPEEDSSWGVRFGVKGYGLDRRGVTGNVSVGWLWQAEGGLTPFEKTRARRNRTLVRGYVPFGCDGPVVRLAGRRRCFDQPASSA